MTLHDISDTSAFKLKTLELSALVDLGHMWEKSQTELSDLRLNRQGDGKTASCYTISVARAFDKGELLLVPWTQHILFGEVGSSKHTILQRDGLQIKGAHVKIGGVVVFEAFLGKPKMNICDPNLETTTDPDKEQFVVPFWQVYGFKANPGDATVALTVHKTKAGFVVPVLKNMRPLNEGDVLRFADKKRELETVTNDVTPVTVPSMTQVEGARGRGSGQKRIRGGRRGS